MLVCVCVGGGGGSYEVGNWCDICISFQNNLLLLVIVWF